MQMQQINNQSTQIEWIKEEKEKQKSLITQLKNDLNK